MNGPDRVSASPAALRVMLERLSMVHKAPEVESKSLRDVIARTYGVPFDCVAVGNGCTELMAALAHIKAGPNTYMLTSAPTFGLYEYLARQFGYEVDTIPMLRTYEHDVTGLLNRVRNNTRLIWLDTPHGNAYRTALRLSP